LGTLKIIPIFLGKNLVILTGNKNLQNFHGLFQFWEFIPTERKSTGLKKYPQNVCCGNAYFIRRQNKSTVERI